MKGFFLYTFSDLQALQNASQLQMHLSQTSLTSSWSKETLADFIYSTMAFPGSFARLQNPWQTPFASYGWWYPLPRHLKQTLSLSRVGAFVNLAIL